jgi:ABC transporter DrrB family efflux protein
VGPEDELMATAAAPLSAGTRYRPISGRWPLVWAILDALVLAKRSVLETLRIPELIMFVAIQPVMFVILFRYVFGGAIQVPGGQYVNYLMPGIFVQTVAFGGVTTAIGLAQDMQRGIIDRFRSLPMSSSAVLTGRTIADLARNLFTVIIMLIVGFLVGFRPGGTPFEFLLGIVVLLGVSFAFSWISAFIGLLVRSVEAAQSGGFIWLFPLTFASSAFVPVATMPSWLRGFAQHNPVSVLADSLRGLFHVNPALTTADTRWALIQSAAWIAGILLVFVPLSVIRYRRTMAR